MLLAEGTLVFGQAGAELTVELFQKGLEAQYGKDISIAAPEKAWKLYKEEMPTMDTMIKRLMEQQRQPKRHGLRVRLSPVLPVRIIACWVAHAAGAPSGAQSGSCLCIAIGRYLALHQARL